MLHSFDYGIVRKGGSDEVRCRVVVGSTGFDYRPLVRREPDGMRTLVARSQQSAVKSWLVMTRLVTIGSFMVTMTLVATALAAVISR